MGVVTLGLHNKQMIKKCSYIQICTFNFQNNANLVALLEKECKTHITAAGEGFGTSTGTGVWTGTGTGIWTGAGAGVWTGICAGAGVWTGAGVGVLLAGVGCKKTQRLKIHKNPFSTSCIFII